MQTIGLIIIVVIIAIASVSLSNRKGKDSGLKKSTIKKVDSIIEDESVMTLENLKEKFHQYGLENHWITFEPLIKKEIRIFTRLKKDSDIPLGKSKFGGLPDLPISKEWVTEENGKPLSFIAQINCKDLLEFDKQIDLPDHGIIYFFYSAEQEAWGFDIKDKDKFKVLYLDDLESLERKDAPVELKEFSVYKSCELKFKNSVSLPSWENDFVRNTLNDNELDNYMEIYSEGSINKIFGYADNIQGEMELECQLVTNGLYCGDPSGYNDPRRPELEKGAKDWNLLLQIDSEDEKTGMMWGDSGRLYFWIKKQDLESLDFDKSWFSLQCY